MVLIRHSQWNHSSTVVLNGQQDTSAILTLVPVSGHIARVLGVPWIDQPSIITVLQEHAKPNRTKQTRCGQRRLGEAKIKGNHRIWDFQGTSALPGEFGVGLLLTIYT